MSRRHSSRLPVSDTAGPRWAIPLILTAVGFAGGLAIAVFYNAALSPVPADSIQAASKATMDGRGGDAVDSPQARARARAARLERIRIDKIMQICSGC